MDLFVGGQLVDNTRLDCCRPEPLNLKNLTRKLTAQTQFTNKMAASATTEAPNFPPPMNNNENEPGPAPSTSAVMDRRAATLVQAFNAALDATLKKISYENFAACFPTTAQHKPETLKRFWKDFVDRLGEKCKVRDICWTLCLSDFR
jgi:hypothetical protein